LIKKLTAEGKALLSVNRYNVICPIVNWSNIICPKNLQDKTLAELLALDMDVFWGHTFLS
jgi:hypothetical protein